MHDDYFLRFYLMSACTLLAALTILLFFAAPATAQDVPEEQEKKRAAQVRVGVYVSWSSVAAANDGPGWGENITSPEDDVMPYPNRFLSIRYNNLQATVGWGDDNYRKEYGHNEHNEDIARFAVRYNFYPAGEVAYIFGGPVLWRFNKEFTFTRYDCTDYLQPGDPEYSSDPYLPSCKPGAEVPVQLTTDRPDGKSIMFGGNVGLGVEYTWRRIVFSHEIEFYFSGCKYKDFICSGGDFKFLGLHFEF